MRLGPDPLSQIGAGSREALAPARADLPSADVVSAVREVLRGGARSSLTGLLLVAFFVLELARSGGGDASWVSVLVLGAILLAHELGHALAMLALGYRDVRVYLVPFLGGLTTGQAEVVTAVRASLVSLAGPLPGLLVAAGWTLHARHTGGARPFFVVPLALLNALNLLPLGSLDGGRVIRALLVGRAFGLEAVFWVLSVLGLGLLALFLPSFLVGGLALLTLAALPARRHLHAAASGLRASWGFSPPGGPVEDLAGKDLALAIHFARASFSSGEPGPAPLAGRVRLVAEEARTEPAGPLGSVVLVALFALGWGAAAVTLATP